MTHLYQPLQPLAADGAALMRVLHAAGVVRTSAGEHSRPPDALLVAQPCTTEQLGPLMRLAGAAGEDDALIVQTRPGRLGDEAEAIAALLRGRGFQAQRRLNDKGRPIFIARRIDCPNAKKAA